MQQTHIKSKKHKDKVSQKSFLGVGIFNIADIVESKLAFYKIKEKSKKTCDVRAATRQENTILSAKAKLAIARQIWMFFSEEATSIGAFVDAVGRERMGKHPWGNAILMAGGKCVTFFEEMNEKTEEYATTVCDPRITEIRKEEQEKACKKYSYMWDFYENFLLLPRLKIISTLLKERQEASLSEFLDFLDKYESTMPEVSIPISEEEISVIENQAHVKVEDQNDDEAGPAESSTPDVSFAAEAVDRANSNDWTKADSDWVVEANKIKKETTLLATRVRKGKEERLSLTLKNPKGDRVPDSLRSQRVPTCSRTYAREGEEWKRKDARHQFPSIVDSYILQYGIIDRRTEEVLIQGKMVAKSYTFVRCSIVSMEWQIEEKPPIILCHHEGASFDTLEYIFSGILVEGEPIGDVYHRFLRPYESPK